MGLERNGSPLRRENVLYLKSAKPRLKARCGRKSTGEQCLEQDRSSPTFSKSEDIEEKNGLRMLKKRGG